MTATIPSPVADQFASASMDVRAVLHDALLAMVAAAGTDAPTLVSASVQVPAADVLACFAAARRTGEDAAYWLQPATGRSFVGVGAATSIDLVGSDRFSAAAAAWKALLTGVVNGGPAAGRPGAGPVLVGGATFADEPSTDPGWTGFERGRLDVPAVLVSTIDGAAILTATVLVDTGSDGARSVTAVMRLVDRILRDRPVEVDAGGGGRLPMLHELGGQPDRIDWSSSVARSSGAVGRGRIDKVVLARRVDIQASEPIDVVAVLGRLATPSVGAATAPVTVFALTRGARTFLGASPERLVEARGDAFRTIALAGTTGRDPDPSVDARLADALLASEKDREEHAVVVEMLRETLTPLASRLEIDRVPHVVRLPTLQHLASDVSGVLREDRGILDLVARLHPTPAVGGWPRAAALELLEEQEHLDRGWYAGPIGWLDAHGDGEFVVAIRSGVVGGMRASLFVGCGIVGDSEPDREWAESGMKLQSLASALGRLEP
jgi:isochorismate synthase